MIWGFIKVIFFATIIVLAVFFHFRTDPGEGQKIGQIVNLSKKGIMRKTWEMELIRGGFVDGSGTMGAVFHLTIENDELASKAFQCMNSGSEVRVSYEMEFMSSSWRSEKSSPNFCKSIEKIR